MVWTTEIIDFTNKHCISGHFALSPYLKGNPLHRKLGLEFKMTEGEMLDYFHCKTNIEHFADKVLSAPLTALQSDLLDNSYRMGLHRIERQSGCLVSYAILMLHELLFQYDKCCIYTSRLRHTNVEVVNLVKRYYEKLPFYLKAGIASWNDTSLGFDTGGRLRTYLTSDNGAMGFSPDFMIMDVEGVTDVRMDEFYRGLFPTLSARRGSRLHLRGEPGSWIDTLLLRCLNEDGTNKFDFTIKNHSDKPILPKDELLLNDIEKFIRDSGADIEAVIARCEKIKGS